MNQGSGRELDLFCQRPVAPLNPSAYGRAKGPGSGAPERPLVVPQGTRERRDEGGGVVGLGEPSSSMASSLCALSPSARARMRRPVRDRSTFALSRRNSQAEINDGAERDQGHEFAKPELEEAAGSGAEVSSNWRGCSWNRLRLDCGLQRPGAKHDAARPSCIIHSAWVDVG